MDSSQLSNNAVANFEPGQISMLSELSFIQSQTKTSLQANLSIQKSQTKLNRSNLKSDQFEIFLGRKLALSQEDIIKSTELIKQTLKDNPRLIQEASGTAYFNECDTNVDLREVYEKFAIHDFKMRYWEQTDDFIDSRTGHRKLMAQNDQSEETKKENDVNLGVGFMKNKRTNWNTDKFERKLNLKQAGQAKNVLGNVKNRNLCFKKQLEELNANEN